MSRYNVGWFCTENPEVYEVIHGCESFTEGVNFLQNHFRWMADDWPAEADRCWELAQLLNGTDLLRFTEGGRFLLELADHTYYISKTDQMDKFGGLF